MNSPDLVMPTVYYEGGNVCFGNTAIPTPPHRAERRMTALRRLFARRLYGKFEQATALSKEELQARLLPKGPMAVIWCGREVPKVFIEAGFKEVSAMHLGRNKKLFRLERERRETIREKAKKRGWVKNSPERNEQTLRSIRRGERYNGPLPD